ncbi:sugar phosphate nucleotidyltransferase [Paenibacillus alkalitolerans]|uniref:sugar phosphate nucleotidyltransferase n=1 Tax=Paenibacillus alkalitolerans TaxID=2799335 RepID=UPI0018F36824|nr:sugar phosphate nucleotidyltransferase [Paenibacillus alkalitolerans]
MKLMLLSGGAGKRLWPLSKNPRSKQFLKILRNRRNERESMVQRVWNQLISANLAGSTFVTTCETQVDMIRSQLGDSAPVIIEPERRDTFAAVALACTYLHSIAGTDANETVCFCPVDPYVEETFFGHIKQLDGIVADSGADIVLMGVTPSYPSEKYGYIVPEPADAHGSAAANRYRKVNRFVEKPKEADAKKLIEEHALWNCGVFAFKLGFMLTTLEKKGFPIEYEEMLDVYSSLPKNSFDHEVVEKAGHLIVSPYNGSWKDLGTWRTLTEELEPLTGKGVISENSENTHVINELDIPVAVMDVSNIIVAVSRHGILISDKKASSKIKELYNDIEHE